MPAKTKNLVLRVSTNHRHLEYADAAPSGDGMPFFYLGDTAWEMLHRLNREETDDYLENRARKGFTVIQTVVLAELDGLNAPNAYGDVPLHDNDPAHLNEPYFAHVDYVLNKAAQLGLFIGLLPTWGSHWASRDGGPTGIFTPHSATTYGRFLGERYADAPLIWILGGDRNVDTPQEMAVIEALARGLREGDGGAHLITFHPRGPGQSSDFLHHAEWLDFNMSQSSHGAQDHDNGLFAEHDYALDPPKPTIDGEPRYENIPVGFYNADATDLRRFDDYDVRQAAYWSILAGACGLTYGNNNVWQMWQPERQPVIGACVPWYKALDHPGAFQMGLMRRFFESRPFHKLVPDQSLILDGPASGGAKIRAARAVDGSYALVYSPRGAAFTLRQSIVQASRVRISWFDPRYGVEHHLHTTDTPNVQTFTPPTSGRGCDWVLVLEAEA